MDLCGGLFILGLVLGMVAIVGHALWLMAAGLGKALFGPPRVVPVARLTVRTWGRKCAGCGNALSARDPVCQVCGLDASGPAAVELRELEVVARRVQGLLDSGALDQPTCDRVYRCIEARQQALLDERKTFRPQLSAVPAAEADRLPPGEEPPVVLPAPPPVVPILPPAPAVSSPAPLMEPAPPPPRRSLGEVLAAFMEERNILWGELVGGLLIVGCSIALVISLWRTLEQIPYFPFLILAALTSLLLGAGLYTLSHWKLESTSRGLLVIGTLLVPLNFLVLAGLSRGREGGLLEILTEFLAMGGFATLVFWAGRVLVSPTFTYHTLKPHALLAAAIVGTSASQLLVPRVLDAGRPEMWLVTVLGLLPVAWHGLAGALVLRGLARCESVDGRQANTLFTFIGMSTFAVAVALGFVLYWSEDVRPALQYLAVPVALAGIPVLVAGALVHRKLEVPRGAMDDTATPTAIPSAELPGRGLTPAVARLVGTATALAGMAVLLVALALAWPVAGALALIGGLNFLALGAVALRYRLPAAHVPALACLTVGYLAAYHLVAGNLELAGDNEGARLLALFLSPASGSALIPLVPALAAVSEWLVRSNRRLDGLFQAAGSGVLALVSLALVTLDPDALPERAALAYGIHGFGAFLLNTRWRRPLLSYAASAALLGSILAVLLWAAPDLSAEQLFLLTLLAHATLLLSGALVLARTGLARQDPVFLVPLRRAALATSLLAIGPALSAVEWAWLTPCALCSAWLAALWLVMAWRDGKPWLFTAFQTALTLAMLLAVSAWLEEQSWFHVADRALYDPRSLHAYGLALAGLGLLWQLARLGLRVVPRAQLLLEPGWPGVDRVILGALVAGQLGLAAWGITPGLLDELMPSGIQNVVSAYPVLHALALEPAAWVLLAILVLALVAALWDTRPAAALVGLVLLALTVPVLAAGGFRTEVAVASALRWGLGLCFVASAACLSARAALDRQAVALGIISLKDADLPARIRNLLLIGTALPVLALTVIVAWLIFAGMPPSGPLPETFFRQMGWVASLVVPLVLVSAGLTGHGLRERSAGHGFAGGLAANLALMGGQALAVVTGGGELSDVEWVRILQLGAVGASIWALAWLNLERFLPSGQDPAVRHRSTPLLDVQVGLGALLLGLVLVPALWLLLMKPPGRAGMAPEYPPAPLWTPAAGSLLGWAALGLVAMAVRMSRWRAVLSWTALAAVGLAACSVESVWPGWGYRTLMMGWAVFAVLAACPPWREDVSLIGFAGLAAAYLGLRAAALHDDHLWGAAALVLVGIAAAVLAVRRRNEGWALAAACCFPIAESLVVAHAHLDTRLGAWWITLVQANLITGGTAALVWLGARRHIYGDVELRPYPSPLLAMYLDLGLACNLIVLGFALLPILLWPSLPLAASRAPAGHLAGWPALVLPLAAALWYKRLVAPGQGVHVAGVGGLLLGVLAACSAALRTEQAGWLAHHLLTLSWTLLGLAILAAAWSGSALAQVGPAFWPPERRAHVARFLATFFPVSPTRRWVEGLMVLVVALALRGAWEDPGRPYWSSGAVLAVAVLLGTMAVWSRRPAYVYASGLMVNVVGLLAWTAWGPETIATFLYTQILCLAAGSGLWSALELALRQRRPPVDLRGGALPYPLAAALAALHGAGLLILTGLASDLTRGDLRLAGSLAWMALAFTTTALAPLWWDADARRLEMPAAPLYAAGLLAIGLGLHGAELSPARLVLAAGLLLAAYAALTTALSGGAARSLHVRRWLGFQDAAAGLPASWFLTAQGVIAGVVAALSVWMALDFTTPADRLTGPTAVALLAAAGFMMAAQIAAGAAPIWIRHVTLGLGVLAAVELSWALLDPTLPALWLQRNALAMAVLALVSLTCEGLRRWLPPASPWTPASRRVGTLVAGLTGTALALMLMQEFALYDPIVRQTPMVLLLVIFVVLALAALIAGGLLFAVVPGQDPLGLSERGRTFYVYAAEVLLVLLLVHLRLNVPDLYPAFLGQYWTVVVMVIAFAGVGLSEWLQRRGWRVLADPLQRTGIFLPLLPLLAFLVNPPAAWHDGLGRAIPGTQPLLRYLTILSGMYGRHALVWFLLGLLYTLVAVLRRSSTFALLAALAANFGLWVLFAHHEQVLFLVHPQLWLIPLALILLAAEFLNRDRLTPSVSLGLRYLALLLIYLSSTADMFIAGLGNSVVLPVMLAVLAILGVLAGIVLRVRAFLFLGVTFLFLVIFAQIWHAAVDRAQTWVWWACGIVLGALVLALFALFEKRRNDVLRILQDLKEWK